MFITKTYNDVGIYALKLFVNSIETVVIVDDYFPCSNSTNEPLFTSSEDDEMWVMLLEKAWAKINGSYGRIVSGWSSHANYHLTG